MDYWGVYLFRIGGLARDRSLATERRKPRAQHFRDVHPFGHVHIPNQVASIMLQQVQRLYDAKTISGEQLLYINGELRAFTGICGACERIKNTPIPYSYSVFIKKFIQFYVATLPFGFVFSLGYWVIPIVGFIFYVLASLELIAEEIEDPFGGDKNDLPLEKMAWGIRVHIH